MDKSAADELGHTYYCSGLPILSGSTCCSGHGERTEVTVSPDGDSLAFESITGWDTGSAVVEIERGKRGTVSMISEILMSQIAILRDSFRLAELRLGQVITVLSKNGLLGTARSSLR